MNPAMIPLILQGIQAAITAAPKAVEVVNAAKALIDSLATAKLITKEEQDALRMEVDSLAALARVGIAPIHWTVEN